MPKLFFTVKEAAAVLTEFETRRGGRPVSQRRVYYLIAMGCVVASRVGPRIRIFLDLQSLSAA